MLLIIGTVALFGCSSTNFHYVNKSFPITKGVTKYYLKNVDVALKLGTNGKGKENDTTYANQGELEKQIETDFKKYLKQFNIYDPNSTDLAISISFDITRNFNFGGKALNIPTFSHSINIEKGDVKVANENRSDYVIDYSFLRNMKIASFLSDTEDERKDIDFICKIIVKDLSNFGN